MNFRKILLACMCSALILSGCGASDKEEPAAGVVNAETSDTVQSDAGQSAVDEPDTEVNADEPDVNDTADEQESDEPEGDGGFRELTQDELNEFTEFIHGSDAYGFLLSEYAGPIDVDLGQVFYSGAGLQKEMTSQEMDAFITANGGSLETDCIKVEKSDVENLVRERLGVGLDEVTTDGIGLYLPEFDAYYHECGDTNYMQYTCVSGLVNGDVYTLNFKADSDIYAFSEVQTILQKTDNGYLFIANHSLSEPEPALEEEFDNEM